MQDNMELDTAVITPLPEEHEICDDLYEFRNNAKVVGVSCKEIPIEAHWAVGRIERVHRPLERAYDILQQEIGHRTNDETILQMAIKALNNTAGLDGLVPTLLVFGAYPRINQDSPPSPKIAERAQAVRDIIIRVQNGATRPKHAFYARRPEGHTIVIVPFLALQQDIKTQYTYMGISCQVWAETEAQVDTATLVTPESFVTKIFQAFVNRPQLQTIGESLCLLSVQQVFLTATLPPRDEALF
ncbi:hypothetical protein B0T24DRAFT_716467 [Lasiosphaeria ovina]|uniref:Uncharacterized protein n=1 Tax=Lasiosphaeria ovina TaxID=92902 RepID=A0AAE0NCV5_9PEZI|nr:hypothetical protein B0T24DRAFT_716467 [Lasiosphaeria ovina]